MEGEIRTKKKIKVEQNSAVNLKMQSFKTGLPVSRILLIKDAWRLAKISVMELYPKDS